MKRMLSLANGRSELIVSFSGFPVCEVSTSASRCTSLSSRSASLLRRAPRSAGVIFDHLLKAWRAALTARSTSSAVPFGTLPTVFSLAGLMTCVRWPEADSTSLPPMTIFMSAMERSPFLGPSGGCLSRSPGPASGGTVGRSGVTERF